MRMACAQDTRRQTILLQHSNEGHQLDKTFGSALSFYFSPILDNYPFSPAIFCLLQELAEAERQANAAERGASSSNQLDEVMRATLASYDAARQAAVSASVAASAPEAPSTTAPPAAAAAAAAVASAESPSATQDASSDSEAPPAASDADGAYFGFRNKQDATEAFIKLLHDHSVPSTSNWGDAVKGIHKTALWNQRIRDIPDKEKRQMFNRYKTQRAKEEKVRHSCRVFNCSIANTIL